MFGISLARSDIVMSNTVSGPDAVDRNAGVTMPKIRLSESEVQALAVYPGSLR
jgi:hypothetical protein